MHRQFSYDAIHTLDTYLRESATIDVGTIVISSNSSITLPKQTFYKSSSE